MKLRFFPPLAVASLLLAASAPAAADDVIEMSFEGFGALGLHLMTTHTRIEERAAAYTIEGDFQTSGIAALAGIGNHSVAQGREADGQPQPVSFTSDTVRKGATQRLHVDFKGSGVPDGSVTPPPQEPVTPVDPRQLSGTVDNLTAYLRLQRQLARAGSCALRVPVFDGRHRYDLRFSDAGTAMLAPAERQNFTGETRVCRMARDEIGGFYIDKKHEEGARAGTIWYAPQLLPGELAVPVRMRMDSEIGEVAVYLSQLRAKRVNLRLMD
jgi:uncharacterized protein DUF3108